MSLGLRLLAALANPAPEPDQVLNQTADWLQNQYSEMVPEIRFGEVEQLPCLFCKLHPAAEEFELIWSDPEHVIASANTSTVGPGYHMFLVSLLKDWAKEFQAAWELSEDSSEEYGDDTGFFFTGDVEQLFDEMSWWLKAITATFFDGTLDADDRGIALCMPLNPQFETEQPAITPLGPRDHAWLQETAQDGRRGKDFFSWWHPGLNAPYYLGRALAQMWSNVRWRPPTNDTERQMLADVAQCLSRAYTLDPNLPYPWAEWNELLDILGARTEERTWIRPHLKGEPTIGYRRGSVRVTLPGGWTIKIPGSFSDFESDQQNDLCAVDPPLEVWFTAFHSKMSPSPEAWQSTKEEMKESHPEYLLNRDSYLSTAKITEKTTESGQTYFNLQSSFICPGKRAVCTIVFCREDEKDWALETWRSIYPPSQNRSEIDEK